LPAVKWAASLNGVTHVAITLLDVLSAVEEIKICVGYEIDGKAVEGYPMHQTDLHHARPIYKSLPGWGEDITWCRMRGISLRPRGTSLVLSRPRSGLLCA
jgi:adenylosuccinate synthase